MSGLDRLLWGLVAGEVGAILALSFGPSPAGPTVALADKAGHGVAYAALTATMLLAAVWRPGRGPGPVPQGGGGVAAGAFLLGVVVELAQGTAAFPGRDADPLDVVANGAGVLLGLAGWRWARTRSGRLPT